MIAPARTSARAEGAAQLAVLRADGGTDWATLARVTDFLRAGDLFVVNVSATLPSSFRGRLRRTGEEIEIRLAAFRGEGHRDLSEWFAVAFGGGTWRTPTEWRRPPPALQTGDEIVLDGARWIVEPVDPRFPRLLRVRWDAGSPEQALHALYRLGAPIQYSYQREVISVFDQQNAFSQIPVSVEPPSAGLQLSWEILEAIGARIGRDRIVPILHGAGISSTGDPELDAVLPLPEYSHIPSETAAAVERARREGARIVAVGTTVFRALESAARDESLRPRDGSFTSTLRIGGNYRPKIVGGLLTGIHEVGSHHGSLMCALQPLRALTEFHDEAERRLFRSHEYGDLALVFNQPSA